MCAAKRWWLSGPDRNESDLNRLTQQYWRGQTVPDYIKNLLPAELKFANENLIDHPCDTLVLLVGYSFEPLLQSVSVFQPARVVLLVNEWYGKRRSGSEWKEGYEHGKEFRQYVQNHLSPNLYRLPAIADEDIIEVSDRPDVVFRALCDSVLREFVPQGDDQHRKDVIVDITGAKKSMVAGAFLFAAYADIPIAYVDFDDYDQDARRPVGYTCRIDLLPNPYERFSLRDWERVRQLYERYHFRDAAETLSKLVGVMRRLYDEAGENEQERERRAPFRLADIGAAEKLLNVLRVYEAWDDGDYHAAEALVKDPEYPVPDGFKAPIVVERLGDKWPFAERDVPVARAAGDLVKRLDALKASIFTTNQQLLPYAHDESAKIDRLIKYNEDYRSALLRAAGLEELLLKARWVRLWCKGWIGIWKHERKHNCENYLGDCKSLEPGLQEKLCDELLQQSKADYMRWVLQAGAAPTDRMSDMKYLDLRGSYRARPIQPAPRLAAYDNVSQLTQKKPTVADLRSAAIHLYLPVPHAIAQDALSLARANLGDLEDPKAKWIQLASDSDEFDIIKAPDVEHLPWDRLCKLCGLDFVPFPPQRVFQAKEVL